jgi:hypothetical protein
MTSARILCLTSAAAVLMFGAAIAPAMAADHPSLSGFWEPRVGSVKRNGQPPYNDVAKAELKKPSKNTDPNGVDEGDTNCLPYGQPWTLYQSAPIGLAQDDREMTMIYEDRTLPWHVYTDGRGHPDLKTYKPTLNGHSIGRWEGDEFVVDSVGFGRRAGHGALMALPNTDATHVVARFKLAAGGEEMHAHFKLEDSGWLTAPWEWDVTWYRAKPDEYARVVVCDARDPANGLR